MGTITHAHESKLPPSRIIPTMFNEEITLVALDINWRSVVTFSKTSVSTKIEIEKAILTYTDGVDELVDITGFKTTLVANQSTANLVLAEIDFQFKTLILTFDEI